MRKLQDSGGGVMTGREHEWIELCKESPSRYRVDVDNDSVFVTDTKRDECVFEFSSFGWEMVIELFRYIGCNVEEV